MSTRAAALGTSQCIDRRSDRPKVLIDRRADRPNVRIRVRVGDRVIWRPEYARSDNFGVSDLVYNGPAVYRAFGLQDLRCIGPLVIGLRSIDQFSFKNMVSLHPPFLGGGGGFQEHDKRLVFQTMYCFSSGTGVHLGHCIIFCYALGCPQRMADEVIKCS